MCCLGGIHYSPIEIQPNRTRRSGKFNAKLPFSAWQNCAKEFIDFSTNSLYHILDSYMQNDYKSGYFVNEQQHNNINTNYKIHNGGGGDTDTRWGEFKAPMPLKNGSSNHHNRIPALVSAKSQAFDGTTMFNRSRYNRPQQTITPHYNRFGEPSELSNFKSVPDLYPIHKVIGASSSNASSYLSSSAAAAAAASSTCLANGYDFSTSKFTNDTSVRSASSKTMPSTSMMGRGRSIFLNSTLNNKNSTISSTQGTKSNLTLYNVSGKIPVVFTCRMKLNWGY